MQVMRVESVLTIRTTECLDAQAYLTGRESQGRCIKSHTRTDCRRVRVHQELVGGTTTEPQDSHSLSEREDPSMLCRLRYATSFGRSSRMGRLNSNRTYMLSTPPSTLSTSTRTDTHINDRETRSRDSPTRTIRCWN